MKKEARDNFKTFINRKFLDWERDTGSRKNFVEFAEYLGVQRGSLGMWMGGYRIPTGDWVHQIAGKLGPEVYDYLGLARPDPDLQLIVSLWDETSDKVKAQVLKLLEPSGGEKRSTQDRKREE